METVSEARVFDGTQGVYRHDAKTTGCTMEFSVFSPRGDGPFPIVWYLSGLTCTQDNATTKAGFQRVASELGLMIICPDTSPRGDNVPDDDAYDFGKGAGFYLNSTEAPWSQHFHMEDYVTEELPALIADNFRADIAHQGITGHSMGGHGALTLWLKNQNRYKSVSAFAPIVSPMNCPWGQKALSGYLGERSAIWENYDACALLRKTGASETPILIDQGLADPFLKTELKPELFQAACHDVEQGLTLRCHKGYDHSYYFIASFIEDHLRWHKRALT